MINDNSDIIYVCYTSLYSSVGAPEGSTEHREPSFMCVNTLFLVSSCSWCFESFETSNSRLCGHDGYETKTIDDGFFKTKRNIAPKLCTPTESSLTMLCNGVVT